MTANKINVNKADINSARDHTSKDIMDAMPLDLMGLLFFAYRDFVHEADELLSRQASAAPTTACSILSICARA